MDTPCLDIQNTVDQILKQIPAEKIILFSKKHGMSGETSSFKLCIIADVADKGKAEKQIYLDVECELPFDVLIYTPDEWYALIKQSDSFASKIEKNGRVLYE